MLAFTFAMQTKLHSHASCMSGTVDSCTHCNTENATMPVSPLPCPCPCCRQSTANGLPPHESHLAHTACSCPQGQPPACCQRSGCVLFQARALFKGFVKLANIIKHKQETLFNYSFPRLMQIFAPSLFPHTEWWWHECSRPHAPLSAEPRTTALVTILMYHPHSQHAGMVMT